MVCALRSQRMAALAGLLTRSHTVADDFGHEKLAVQHIHREFREADEANLIDEIDMHVFGLRPMTDPLHLVCCNACKKPIKASQYVIHAELCNSLNCSEEIGLELDGGTGNKKPPRKDRKKLLAVNSNQITTVIDRGKFEILDASDISAPELCLEAPPTEGKNDAVIVDVLGTGRSSNCLGNATSRPKKRAKMSKADGPQPLLHLQPANGDISQEALLCGEDTRRSTTGVEKTSSQAIMDQIPRQLSECYTLNKDVPVPLATKVYYSQRNQRLRSAVRYMYSETSNECHSNEFTSAKICQPNADRILTSSPNSYCSDQFTDYQQDKEVDNCLYSAHKQDKILSQSSELNCKSGGFPPDMNISDQFPVNNVLGPQTTLGKMTSNYFSNSYSFADSSCN